MMYTKFVCSLTIALFSISHVWAQNHQSMPNLTDITQVAAINGVQHVYYDMGIGPVVLLLHGFPDSKYLWRFQLKALSDAGYRVIVPDLRGFGDAPKPERVSAYGTSEILADVTDLLSHLQIDKVHVVGHDWGGHIAWSFAARYPAKTLSVSGITVGAIGAPGRRTLEQMEKLWYIFLFLYEDIAEAWLSRDSWQGLKAWTRGNGDLDMYIKHLSRPGALTAALNWYRANFNPASVNGTGQPARIQVPAMGIAAAEDNYLLEDHVKTSDTMIDASWTYHLVADASHWVMLDQPEVFNRLLIDFLKSVDE